VSIIRRSFKDIDDDIESAGLKPSRDQLEVFAAHLGVKVPETEEEIEEWWKAKKRIRRRVGSGGTAWEGVGSGE